MSIKNIIFDFGGVIYDIDIPAAARAFRKLGITDFEQKFTVFTEANIFDKLETGHLTPGEFRDEFRRISELDVSDKALDEAWNALLIGFRKERIKLIGQVKKQYNVFLLSNSNIIHYRQYRQEFEDQFGYKTFDELFQQAFFSFEVGQRNRLTRKISGPEKQ
ncbi:MAG: HAD family phosphatase [Bacteroidota bacterium]